MRRISKSVAVGVSVVSLMGVTALTATTSSAGSASHLIVDKAVEGTQPEGSQFTIVVTCTPEGGQPEIDSIVIDGPGNVVDAGIPTTPDGVACTITESEDGGATSVTFSCDDDGVATCEADNRIEFPQGENGEGTITVTNTFEEPTPPTPEPAAAAIETVPAFTG